MVQPSVGASQTALLDGGSNLLYTMAVTGWQHRRISHNKAHNTVQITGVVNVRAV